MIDLLPTELVEQICNVLETGDMSRLRLVCRQLSEKASRSFEHACFSSVTTSLYPESLDRVRKIVQHERANQTVQSLTVSVHRIFPCEEACSEHFQLAQTRHGDDLPSDLLQRLPGNCRKALFPAEADESLRELLADGALPNCRSFAIEGACDDETFFPTVHVGATDTLLTLLSCISESHRPVEAFTLQLLHDEAGALDPARIPASCYRNPGFVEAWGANLRDLCLTFRNDQELDPMAGLTASAVKVQKLELRTVGSKRFGELLNGIHAYNPSWNPPLCQLTLRGFQDVKLDALLSFLVAFSDTLQNLSLSFMKLHAASWQKVLFTLLRCHARLHTIYLRLLGETYTDASYWVQFRPVENLDDELPANVSMDQDSWSHVARNMDMRGKGVSYEGPLVAAVLRYLIGTSHVCDFRRGVEKAWEELDGCVD